MSLGFSSPTVETCLFNGGIFPGREIHSFCRTPIKATLCGTFEDEMIYLLVLMMICLRSRKYHRNLNCAAGLLIVHPGTAGCCVQYVTLLCNKQKPHSPSYIFHFVNFLADTNERDTVGRCSCFYLFIYFFFYCTIRQTDAPRTQESETRNDLQQPLPAGL